MNKRQDTLVASQKEFTILQNALLDDNYKVGKKNKMKFPRRNSLNFPLRKEKTPVLEDDGEADTYDLLKDVDSRSSDSKSAYPISSEIKKALSVLNDNDQHSLSATSSTSSTTVSTIDDDEILKIKEFPKGEKAISTPVPQQKQKLQIPKAKRRDMAILSSGADESPTSVAETLDLASLSVSDTPKKKSKKKSSRDSSEKSTKSRDKSSDKTRRRSSKKSRKPRKKVHFKQTCTMRRTLSRHDMTPKEIRRAWLSCEEYQRMQIRDEILADRVDMGKVKPGTCIRGLESKIEETAMRKLNLRLTGSEDVLIEQERQWDEAGDEVNFFYDFPAFADVYGPVSEEALMIAQETAKLDRQEAVKILESSTPFRSKGLRSRFTRRRSWA